MKSFRPRSHDQAAASKNGDPVPKTWNSAWGAGVIAIKLALIAVIAWLLFPMLRALFEKDAEPPTIADADAALAEPLLTPPVPPLLLSAFEDGAWEFAGMPWQLRMATVEPGEIEQELAALPPAGEQPAMGTSEEGDQLLAMFRKLGAEERKYGQLTLLTSGSPAGRMVLVTRAGPRGESIVLGRLAWAEEGRWRLVEGRPTTPAKSGVTSAEVPPPVLLAEIVGTRWGKDGTLLGQILTVGGDRDSLIAAWKQAGWSVNRSPAVSGAAEEDSLLLVERGGVCYAAHFFAPSGELATLFLTRVPD